MTAKGGFPSTFKQSARPNEPFFYQIGSVSTSRAWNLPNFDKIQAFLDDVKKLRNYEKYRLFLVGGVMNGGIGKTTDVDILINGDLEIREFEAFLHDLHDLGLNVHGLLIDAKWIDKEPAISLEPIRYVAVQFGRVVKKIGEHSSIIDMFETNKKLSEYLIERTIDFPSEKNKRTTNKFASI